MTAQAERDGNSIEQFGFAAVKLVGKPHDDDDRSGKANSFMHDATTTASVSLESTQRPTRVRYLMLVLVALASSSAYLTRYCITVAATTIRGELHLTNEQMGNIFGAFSWGYLVFQIPGGLLGTRFGTRLALPLLSSLWSGFTIATAATASFVPMFATRFAFGSAQAGLVPNSAKVLKDWIPLHERGLSSALIAASMSIGGAATMELTAHLIDSYHWRTIFRAYSLVGIAWAILFYFFFRTRPQEHPWVNEAERRLIRGESRSTKRDSGQGMVATKHTGEAEGNDPDENDSERGLGDLIGCAMSRVTLWAVCLQAIFRAAGYGLFVTFFPTFLEEGYQVSTKTAGMMAKWPLIAVVVGALSGGFLVDLVLKATGSRRWSRNGVAFVSLGLCGLITLSSAWTTSAGQLVTVIAIGAMFSGLAGPAVWAVTIDVAGKRPAVIMAVMNMAGCLAGIAVPPYLGRLIDTIKESNGDWNQVIYLHVFFYLTAAVCFFAVNPNRIVTDPRTATD